MGNLELLKSLGAEIISSVPEYQRVTPWSGIATIFVLTPGIFWGIYVFLCVCDGYRRRHHFKTGSGRIRLSAYLMALAGAALVALATLVMCLASLPLSQEEPTGKTLYTVVVSDQTDMAELQRNFDIIENVTLNTITVRDKDEPAAMLDPAAISQQTLNQNPERRSIT